MVGGTVVDIVKVSPTKWWVNCVEKFGTHPQTCAIYLDPRGNTIEVGDIVWWQGDKAMWTTADRARTDVQLPKLGYSGVAHPDARTHARL